MYLESLIVDGLANFIAISCGWSLVVLVVLLFQLKMEYDLEVTSGFKLASRGWYQVKMSNKKF